MTGFNVLLGIQMGYNSVWMLFLFKNRLKFCVQVVFCYLCGDFSN